MRTIDFEIKTKVKKNKTEEFYNAIRKSYSPNKDLAARQLAKDLKELNKILRQANQVYANLLKIGQSFLFDYSPSQGRQFQAYKENIGEKIAFVFRYASENNKEVYKTTVFYIVNNICNFIVFITLSCKKLKYTGFEYEVQCLQYSLDRVMFDLRALCQNDNVLQFDSGKYEKLYNDGFQHKAS